MSNKNKEKSIIIEMIHEPKDNNEGGVRIFGEIFVQNNKDKEYELTEFINDIDDKYNNKNKFTIYLKGIENITNIKEMFFFCKTLISVSGLSELDTKNVTDISWMFSNCHSLKSIPDISNWNTNRIY